MDWIDEKFHTIKDKLQMQTLRKALITYIIISVLVVIIAYGVTLCFCNSWRSLVYDKYSYDTSVRVPFEYWVTSNLVDSVIIKAIDITERFSVLIYSVAAIIITSDMFYKNKILQPITILKEEAKHISRRDLSFSCRYESGDELGDICSAYDDMRKHLIKNDEKLWDIMKQQRQLNAAFAHDLRTPLTVMKGYCDLLSRFYPQGKITEEKLMETIDLLSSQVERLRGFSETMNKIHTFDSLEIKKEKTKITHLADAVVNMGKALEITHHVKVEVDRGFKDDESGYFDMQVVMEVIDNLLSNALSYARKKINIFLETDNDILRVYIKDDGKGFSKEEIFKASGPYYSGRKDRDGHFGIGLTICKLLCEKHGGNITLTNSTKGGAVVCADFFIA